ncbi:unnamed protein product [Camellia sinensis]
MKLILTVGLCLSVSLLEMAISRLGRRQQVIQQRHGLWRNRNLRGFASGKSFRFLLLCLVLIAILPPIFFHFKLRHFHQIRLRKCGWLNNPPLVCAHGGDSTKAFPNTYCWRMKDALKTMEQRSTTLIWSLIFVSASSFEVVYVRFHAVSMERNWKNGILHALYAKGYVSFVKRQAAHFRPLAFLRKMAAYHTALHSQVDCIEIDVSRSSDGILFALHDRQGLAADIREQYVQGWALECEREIKELDHDQNIPTVEDALKLISSSVRQIILDAKVGPPSYEKGLAKDILSVVERTQCKNCVVWAKSDNLARDVMKLSPDVMVGYIVMKDPSTGARNNLLRMRGASVVGVFHPLIDEKLMKILHGRNKKVYAWTVDDQVSMKKMLYENVDAVVTSNPTLLQHLMQDIRTQCLEEGKKF